MTHNQQRLGAIAYKHGFDWRVAEDGKGIKVTMYWVNSALGLSGANLEYAGNRAELLTILGY